MQGGYTALMKAASNGHVNVVQCLVQSGASLAAATRYVSVHVVWAYVEV